MGVLVFLVYHWACRSHLAENIDSRGQNLLVEEQPDPLVAVVSEGGDLCQQKEQLEQQLCTGPNCIDRECATLVKVIHAVFALSNEELGETSLVEHEIRLTDFTPITTHPRRLPYALKKELEGELTCLHKTGCTESSDIPYSSGFVLVRKKDGGLHMSVDINKLTVPD